MDHFLPSVFAITFQMWSISSFDPVVSIAFVMWSITFAKWPITFLSPFFAVCSITFVDHFFGDQFFRSLLQCVQSLFLFSLSHVFKHFSGSLFWITFSCHFCNELIHFSAHFFRSLLHYLSHFFRSLLQCGQSLFSITFCSHFLGSLFSLTFDRLTFLFCAPSRKK